MKRFWILDCEFPIGRSKSKKIFCLALAAMFMTLSFLADAQQPGKVYRVGYLSARLGIDSMAEGFRQGLRDRGYVEGQNLVIEWRFAKGRNDLFPELAAELVRLRLDCILAVGIAAIRSVRELTDTIPIVMGTIDADPVELGFIASLARPGGNITGLTGIAYDIAGKRLELLKETIPKASRVAILVARGSRNPGPGPLTAAQAHIRDTEAAARALGVQLQLLEVREPEGLDKAFRAARRDRAEGLTVVATGFMNSHRPRIVSLAVNARLPSIYSNSDFVRDGGLMSYAADIPDQFRRAATYVDKILKGTKPADLPVEQPTKFEFIINLKAAKQIGLTIPPNVLARADRVIR
jgi:putative tryptophan/tyrosine transport system substrate-binding protein